ncbi:MULTISPECIES: hypothetical protein [Bradyrhizobium]|uniref:Cysteine rich repeat-containing protein n=1 Tax=Bradyrhizobium yuanmingense TaxID=108015 RepID=A0A0R3CYW3_9BRAD|nr:MULTISPECIES: hypothetical protein [Bradyrhizobium]KRQ02713.1 hypothetical protein AOQ72_06425 [Bradyrhizobium yuanmingense]MCA1385718.1 hypothetical protein [Bradyrhizobium sp. BRP05]MCA1422482.1 hypothetical protein [Bradyrhizobium sp. BRP23]
MVQRFGRAASGPVVRFSHRAAVYVRAGLAAASLIALLVLFLSQASAGDARSEAKQACKADYSRFCAGTMPGGGRIRKCLGDNYASLSAACKQAFDANPPK